MTAVAEPLAAQKTFDVNSFGVDWSVFQGHEEKILKKAVREGRYEHLAAMIYDVTPEKADQIAKIQKQLRPRSFKHESRAQKEFEEWVSKNGVTALTPEIEAEFQDKINAERKQALDQLTGGVAEADLDETGGTNEASIEISNRLDTVKGIGAKSVQKLYDAGIMNVEELRALPNEDRVKILGPLVANKLNYLQPLSPTE